MKFPHYLLLFFVCCSDTALQEPAATSSPGRQEDTFQKARHQMVERQIVSRGIRDPKVLQAMRAVRRHLFIPKDLENYAYRDGPLPIGKGQTISQPYIVALMTELLEPEEGDRILEIGTGSGYQAAVLAKIVKEIYTIEIVPELGKGARKILKELGYKNIHVRIGDGYRGWPEKVPFDGIIATAAPDHIPQPLIDQLKEGAHLVIPVGKFFQKLLVITRTSEGIQKREVIPVRFVPMTGEAEERD